MTAQYIFFEKVETFTILVLFLLTIAPSEAIFANSCATFYNLTISKDVSLVKPSELQKPLKELIQL